MVAVAGPTGSGASTGTDPPGRGFRIDAFVVWMVGLALAALLLRLGYASFVKWDQRIWGDAAYYHAQANGLFDGHGFAGYQATADGIVRYGAEAQHPPLTTLYLALWSLVGLSTFHWHMVAGCVLGAATVVALGYTGREIAGPRAGILAAAIAVVTPSLWSNDVLVMSETVTEFVVALALLTAYRYWRAPKVSTLMVLGGLCALGALARTEIGLLIPFMLVPLALRTHRGDRRSRWKALGAALAVAALVLAPWLIRNATLDPPVIGLSNSGAVLMVANCPEAYDGPAVGWWAAPCQINELLHDDAAARERGLHFIKDHLGALPRVALFRLGRMFEVYEPGSFLPGAPEGEGTIALQVIDGQTYTTARLGLLAFYLLAVGAIAGGVIMFRRRITLIPVYAVLATVAVTALVAYGNTRFRTPFDLALVVLTGVAIDAAWSRIRRQPPGGDGPGSRAVGDPARNIDPDVAGL